jgi:hypothetical protein
MAVVQESAVVPLAPAAAERLWADTSRWPVFVDGFKRVVEEDPRWPDVGAKIVWESGPAGRGRVTERVVANAAGHFATEVFEEQLTGTQTVRCEPDPDGAAVQIALDYRLQKGGPLRAVADAIFIRRAISDALGRTLRRFATEAAEESTP